MGRTFGALSGRLLLWLVDSRHAVRFWRLGLHRRITSVRGQGITWYAGRDPGDSRPLIVCLHGFLDRGYAFRRLIPVLNSHAQIVVVDLPGFGRSFMPPEAHLWTVESMAQILAELLERISEGRPLILLSHSVGGVLALRLALMQRKERFRLTGMIALAPGFGLTRKDLRSLQHSFFPNTVAEVQDLIMRIAHGRMREASAGSVGLVAPAIPERMARALLDRWSDAGLQMLARHTLANPDEAILGVGALRRCRLPVLLIHGSEDRVLPVGHARRLQRAFPEVEAHILEGAGHALHLEAADEIGRIIAEAIRRRFLPEEDTTSRKRPRPRSGK